MLLDHISFSISQGLLLIGMLAICHAAEHAYSSQSITRYDVHHQEEKHQEPKHQEEKHQEPKHYEEKHQEPKHEEKPAPKKVETKAAVPVAHYVEASSGKGSNGGSNGHSSHKPATSYQKIYRHDVPAKAPKDFYEHNVSII